MAIETPRRPPHTQWRTDTPRRSDGKVVAREAPARSDYKSSRTLATYLSDTSWRPQGTDPRLSAIILAVPAASGVVAARISMRPAQAVTPFGTST